MAKAKAKATPAPEEPAKPRMSDVAKQWLDLDALKKAAEKALDLIKTDLGKVEETLKIMFKAEDVQSIKIDGKNVHQRREIWPKLPDVEFVTIQDPDFDPEAAEEIEPEDYPTIQVTPKDALIVALKSDEETASMVSETYNTQTLRGYLGSLPDDPKTLLPVLPPHLEGRVLISEIYRIRAVKA